MDFKFEEEVMYAGQKAKVIGVVPAYFQVGYFPEGIDDIDVRYMELDWDKSKFEGDTVLIEVENRLIRVAPIALEKIEHIRKVRAKSISKISRSDAKKAVKKEKK